MKKRAISLFIASVCAASILSCGCGDNSIFIPDGNTDSANTKTITVFGHRSDRYSLGVMEQTLQSFMSESQCTATYESAAEKSYWQALDRRYASDNLDDVFMIEHDRLLKMTDKLADISELVNAELFNNFARSQLSTADGKIYAVPTAISTYGLFVNFDLLNEHGFKNGYSNFKDFTEVCEYFAKREITPIVCNNSSSLVSLILSVGLYDTYYNADTASEIQAFNADPTLLIPHLEYGIDFVCDMIDRGWIDLNEASTTVHASGDIELFAKGDRPFMVTGGWASDTLKEVLDGRSLNYWIYPYPVLERGSVLVTSLDYLCVKEGEKTDEAKKLLSLLTRPDAIISLNKDQSRISPLKTAPSTELLHDPVLIPTANHLNMGKAVISGDMRLSIPLESYLKECIGLLLYSGADADTVKTHLTCLLGGAEDE